MKKVKFYQAERAVDLEYAKDYLNGDKAIAIDTGEVFIYRKTSFNSLKSDHWEKIAKDEPKQAMSNSVKSRFDELEDKVYCMQEALCATDNADLEYFKAWRQAGKDIADQKESNKAMLKAMKWD